MAHEEFPPLTQEAADVLRDAEHDLNLTDPDWRWSDRDRASLRI